MDKEIDLKQINTMLIKADEQFATALKEMLPIEMEYTTEYNKRLINVAGLATQALREAEVIEGLKNDGFWLKYKTAELNVRLAKGRLETLRTVSSNMRTIAFGD